MSIAESWPRLDSDAQAWLIAHNGEAKAPDAMSKIVAIAGREWEDGESGPDGVFLTHEGATGSRRQRTKKPPDRVRRGTGLGQRHRHWRRVRCQDPAAMGRHTSS